MSIVCQRASSGRLDGPTSLYGVTVAKAHINDLTVFLTFRLEQDGALVLEFPMTTEGAIWSVGVHWPVPIGRPMTWRTDPPTRVTVEFVVYP